MTDTPPERLSALGVQPILTEMVMCSSFAGCGWVEETRRDPNPPELRALYEEAQTP